MKIVITGAGVIGRVHLKALLELGIMPAAICDIDEEKANTMLRELHLDLPVFGDYRDMLDKLQPDSVHICTPHYLHADMIVEALSRGVNVLCEKPLCIKREDIPRILAAEKASNAMLGVCHQNRYNPANLFAREYLAGKTVRGGHGTVAWHRDASYYRSADWRGKWATEGGGVMINQALHTLDLMQWMLGYPAAVTASISNLSLGGEIEVEDTAVATFAGKAPFTFLGTNAAGASLPVQITVRTTAEELVLLPHSVIVDGKCLFHEEKQIVLGKTCYGNGHVTLISDFYDCVKSGRRFAIDGTAGAAVINMILAMYESKGERVEL